MISYLLATCATVNSPDNSSSTTLVLNSALNTRLFLLIAFLLNTFLIVLFRNIVFLDFCLNYWWQYIVIDYISGMTDDYALEEYKILHAIK
ncbi:hypothetical protein ACN9J2_11695 [Aliarcobacter butzleri]|uniref:hypothetical protein n=1 Tax=Aliarcobacter TaxID=2321111 RepID=UPI003B21650D